MISVKKGLGDSTIAFPPRLPTSLCHTADDETSSCPSKLLPYTRTKHEIIFACDMTLTAHHLRKTKPKGPLTRRERRRKEKEALEREGGRNSKSDGRFNSHGFYSSLRPQPIEINMVISVASQSFLMKNGGLGMNLSHTNNMAQNEPGQRAANVV